MKIMESTVKRHVKENQTQTVESRKCENTLSELVFAVDDTNSLRSLLLLGKNGALFWDGRRERTDFAKKLHGLWWDSASLIKDRIPFVSFTLSFHLTSDVSCCVCAWENRVHFLQFITIIVIVIRGFLLLLFPFLLHSIRKYYICNMETQRNVAVAVVVVSTRFSFPVL